MNFDECLNEIRFNGRKKITQSPVDAYIFSQHKGLGKCFLLPLPLLNGLLTITNAEIIQTQTNSILIDGTIENKCSTFNVLIGQNPKLTDFNV